MTDVSRLVGKHVDKYIVKEHLKRGGMADVYLAHDEGLDRPVALKVALPQFTADAQFVERFRREAKAVARLRHPNIVQVYATGVTPEGDNYIAMEYVAGGTLTELLDDLQQRGEVMTTAYVLAIIRQVAGALNVAHQAGIIHRDLKPSNILMRRDATPVLTDLGIAFIKDDPRLTRTHALMGTPNYMSPEQAAGGDIDARSDIYSLGVILYELLAGARPFNADTPWGVIHKHLYEQPLLITEVRRDLTVQTAETVHTCLQKDPNARYQNAAGLVTGLDTALMAEGSGGYVTSAGYWQWQAQPTSRPRVKRETVIMQAPTEVLAASTPGYTPSPGYTPARTTQPAPPPPVRPVPQAGGVAAAPPARRRWLWGVGALLLLLVPALFFALRGLGADETAMPPTATTDLVVVVAEADVDAAAGVETPLATLTAEATPAPLETAVLPATATETAVPPSATPTQTDTPAATATPSATAVATATPTVTRTPTRTPTPTPGNPTTGLSSGSGLPLRFEEFGTWVRGDEPNGVFVSSAAQVHAGSSAGRLNYAFDTAGNDYVVFLQTNAIAGSPNALQIWVYGDGSAHFLNAWIVDADGQTWQVPFGQVFHTGWAQMTGYIETDQSWPWTHISGPDDGVVDYPISFRGFVLDDYNSSYVGSGTIYLDDLTATTLSGPIAGVTPAAPTPTTASGGATATPGGAQPTATAVPPVGSVGRIVYTSGSTLLTTDPAWTAPRELGTVASDTCSSPASTVAGQSFTLYYGNYCGIGQTGTGVCTSPNGAYEVITNHIDGGHSIVVRPAGSDSHSFVYQGQIDTGEGIRWSPGSDSFLFVVGDTVHRAFTNGGYNQIIPTAYGPIFSLDGSLILYRKPIGPGVNDIFVSNADGTNARNLTNVSAIDKRCPAWVLGQN